MVSFRALTLLLSILLTSCGKPVTEISTLTVPGPGTPPTGSPSVDTPAPSLSSSPETPFKIQVGSLPLTATASMALSLPVSGPASPKTIILSVPANSAGASIKMDSATALSGGSFKICSGLVNAQWTLPAGVSASTGNVVTLLPGKSLILTVTGSAPGACTYEWNELKSAQRFRLALAVEAATGSGSTPTPTPSATLTPTPSPANPSTAYLPNDYSSSTLWGLDAINAPAAWFKHRDCSNIAIAVIDTGILHTHEDLVGQVDPGFTAFKSGTPTLDDTDSLANDGHGSHVAGTIGAKMDNGKGITGICPGARLIPVKSLENGSTSGASLENGLDWLVEEQMLRSQKKQPPLVVANLSLGGTLKTYTYNGSGWVSDNAIPTQTLTAIKSEYYGTSNTPGLWRAIRDSGISLMLAAGNGAAISDTTYFGCIDVNPDGTNKSSLVSPGSGFDISTITPKISSTECLVTPGSLSGDVDYPNVVSVSAIQKSGTSFSLTAFSNYGSNVQIAAPGKSIKSCSMNSVANAYTESDGTSMATPHVTGVWAWIISKRLKQSGNVPSPNTVRTELLGKASVVNSMTYRNRTQAGGQQTGVVGGKVLDMKNLE